MTGWKYLLEREKKIDNSGEILALARNPAADMSELIPRTERFANKACNFARLHVRDSLARNLYG